MSTRGRRVEGIPAGSDSVIDEQHEIMKAIHMEGVSDILHNLDELGHLREALDVGAARRAHSPSKLRSFIHGFVRREQGALKQRDD
ncbi:MAG: hypothetical protein KGH58_03375 [Candidatus Micrarchaeota archaeon]|nr:hypothetical protein [Candidatus Micrarchaeota archaeon]